jgi:hypothetical protein
MKLDLGNLMFPKMPPDLRRRRMATIYLTALVSIILGLIVYKLMFVMNHHPGRH